MPAHFRSALRIAPFTPALVLLAAVARAEPPFFGTIFIDPDIITASDPSTFQSATYFGQAPRLMFDRRVNAFVTYNAYLFSTAFSDTATIVETQVNPEFGSPAASQIEAAKYALVIGRLPLVLRTDVQTIWIHQGVQPFGGGNHNLLIHTGQADVYAADGILEETFVHEASHTSLDAPHAASPGWLAAQAADPDFISTYARDNPTSEDVAESFLPYYAVRYRTDRISESLADIIQQTIPNRIAYFDAHIPPPHDPADLNVDGFVGAADLAILLGAWGSCPAPPFNCLADLNHDAIVSSADLALLLGAWG